MTEQKSQVENENLNPEITETSETTEKTEQTVAEESLDNSEVVETDALEEAIARVQELEEELREASKKEQDLLLRTRAEIDNIRRRTEQDVEKAHKFALEKFAKEILTIIYNLERAFTTQTTSEDESIKAMFEGVDLTLKHLLATVAKFGIEAVGAEGETFNPELHQAISMQPTEGFSANQITNVLQKGYLLNGRVIRPAMVMVAA